jgi:trans-aconitate methyltransferase
MFVRTHWTGPDKQERHPVLEYVSATGLRPIIKAVGGADSADGKKFLEEYERLLNDEYPLSTVNNVHYRNGEFITLFPFKRFFVLCQV